MARTATSTSATSANLGFETKLWAAAAALRNNMDAAEYKHVARPIDGVLVDRDEGSTPTKVACLCRTQRFRASNIRKLSGRHRCKTYTNAARDEIVRRTEYDPLFVVCTIHSFAWSKIQGFNADIRAWLKDNLQREVADLQAEEGKAGRAPRRRSPVKLKSILISVGWSGSPTSRPSPTIPLATIGNVIR